jgi:hypothetical protein
MLGDLIVIGVLAIVSTISATLVIAGWLYVTCSRHYSRASPDRRGFFSP